MEGEETRGNWRFSSTQMVFYIDVTMIDGSKERIDVNAGLARYEDFDSHMQDFYSKMQLNGQKMKHVKIYYNQAGRDIELHDDASLQDAKQAMDVPGTLKVHLKKKPQASASASAT